MSASVLRPGEGGFIPRPKIFSQWRAGERGRGERSGGGERGRGERSGGGSVTPNGVEFSLVWKNYHEVFNHGI